MHRNRRGETKNKHSDRQSEAVNTENTIKCSPTLQVKITNHITGFRNPLKLKVILKKHMPNLITMPINFQNATHKTMTLKFQKYRPNRTSLIKYRNLNSDKTRTT